MDKRVAMVLFSVATSFGSWIAMSADDPDSIDWVFVDKSGTYHNLTVRLTAGVVSSVHEL